MNAGRGPAAGRRRWLARSGRLASAAAAAMLGACAAGPWRVGAAGLPGGIAGPAADSGTASGAATAPLPIAPPALEAGPPVPGLTLGEQPPAPPRELRGAWVATVANIDWPSRPGLSGAEQRAEALVLMDRAAATGLNALFLQVRPSADAIYPSALEPWTEYLSGTQGRGPDDGHDPLAFWLTEARRRGLQLHAWINPYRARGAGAKSAPAALHVSQRAPDLVRRYGEQSWLDPSEPGAAAHTLAVVADLLRRYDLDGLHIDDYFYPYPVTVANGSELPFPDDARWAQYLTEGGTLERADWRRRHVDSLVQALQRTVRQIRPQAIFGISPFGLPQPALRPPGITGFSQYDKLYADVERWLREGWMDYCAPQLYWPIDRPGQAFEVLLDTWLALTPRALGLWPGLFTSMVGASRNPWPADELLAQLARLRLRPAAGGHIHFSLVALAQDRDGLATRLRQGPYAEAALPPAFVPATLALSHAPAAAPAGRAAGSSAAPAAAASPPSFVAPVATAGLSQTPALPELQRARTATLDGLQLRAGVGGAQPRWWAVWRRIDGAWRFATQPAARTEVAWLGADAVVVSAVSRQGIEGPRRLAMQVPAAAG